MDQLAHPPRAHMGLYEFGARAGSNIWFAYLNDVTHA